MTEKLADPAPLGLISFGATTMLVSLIHHALSSGVDSIIIGIGLAYGGLAQVIAGLLEYRRGNTFGMVAFTSYGLFWWSYAILNLLPRSQFFFGYSLPSYESFTAYYVVWGLFTLVMYFGTLKASRALQIVFITLTTLFFLIAAKSAILAFTTMTPSDLTEFSLIIGVEGVITGFSAFYLGLAKIINEVHQRSILPIGQPA
jgi:succinate-acetate transporter protein